jgi:hypothetical protein
MMEVKTAMHRFPFLMHAYGGARNWLHKHVLPKREWGANQVCVCL